MTPSNPNADAVMYALSLIAVQTDAIFPRELMTATCLKMLETLRGAAKRSKNASAMGFLFAALAKSPIFHNAMCTEHNLSILSKLLVGGSVDVLCASSYALGVVGMHAQDTVKELLFRVDAPQNVLKLLLSPQEKVVRTAIFALACIINDGLVLAQTSGKAVYPDVAFPESLRDAMLGTCRALLASKDVFKQIYDRAIHQLSTGSTYAAKLLASLCLDDYVKVQCCNPTCVEHMLQYTRSASSAFLPTCLAFFIECTNITTQSALAQEKLLAIADVDKHGTWTSESFCVYIQHTQDCFPFFIALFQDHPPDRLFGLPVLFSNFVKSSHEMKTKLSIREVVDNSLLAITRFNHANFHEQTLHFLDDLTQEKNQTALTMLFEHDPDRVANLLHSTHMHIQLVAATILRRLFKRIHATEIPSVAAKRHLVKLMGLAAPERRSLAVAACRVWGNLFLVNEKRAGFAKTLNAVEVLLVLLSRCAAECTDDLKSIDGGGESSGSSALIPTPVKNLHIVIRSIYRAALNDEVQNVMVAAPHFLCIVDLFTHFDERISHLAISTMTEIARTSSLRKHVAVAAVLTAVNTILRGQDPGQNPRTSTKIDCLKLLSVLDKKEPLIQNLLVEYKLLDAIVLLLHAPLASLDWRLLQQCLETLGWISSGIYSPIRKIAATSKMVDFTLRHVDSAREQTTSASLHLLQRLSTEKHVQDLVKTANGPSIIMRALSNRNDAETKRRACLLIRNLVTQHDSNRKQFQNLGVNSYLVALITSCRPEAATLKLRINGLYALSAMTEGISAIAKASKQEVVECDDSPKLLRLVGDNDDKKLCAAWCYTLAMLAMGSSSNQKKLVDTGLVELLVKFMACKHQKHFPAISVQGRSLPLPVIAAQLLAYLASLPENRSLIMREGGTDLLVAIIDALQSEIHDLQRFTALVVANLATRNDDNKVRIGASGAIPPLVDRLSSKQLNVLENVLTAVMKLGSHAGNKVKFGSKVCFEKLLSLVRHEELAIRKGAVSTIAVLIEGNDVNKKFLVQCETSVVTELCALVKSTNGKVIESAMLILGELSLLPDQTLEISKYIDILVIVRMMEHVNVKIKRAALNTAVNLTKESFNKLRFGIKECIAALLLCLKSDDLIIVELAVSCLANLSFTAQNASRITQSKSLMVLLKLAAASTTSKDYLTWKEARFLRLDKNNTEEMTETGSTQQGSPNHAESVSPSQVTDEKRDAEDEGEMSGSNELAVYSYCDIEGQTDQVLDFSSFPNRQTSVLEQTLLVLSNCAEEYHDRNLVEKVAIKVVCQALHHPSELVKRCSCFILGSWCKKDPQNQEIATNRCILPTLIQLLNSPNLNIVEAAMYALCKLSYFGDNHMKMLNLDLLSTLVQGILRRPGNLTHDGLLDRSLRLLGTLVRFPKIRQVLKSEEIISDILTNLLQIHKDALAKNISRLILAMLKEESLKFFLPKKTVMLLRAIFTDDSTSTKTIRNVLNIFQVIAVVEEHKTTITLEDSGDALGKMVQELYVAAEMEESLMRIPACAPNAQTILSLLAGITSTKRVAVILYEKKVYTVLPQYLMPYEFPQLERTDSISPDTDDRNATDLTRNSELLDHLQLNTNAVIVAKLLCVPQPDKVIAKLSSLEMTTVMLNLLRSVIALKHSSKLVALSFECLLILEKLCLNSHDQLVMFHEGAVGIFAYYLSVWLEIVSDRDRVENEELNSTTEFQCEALAAISSLKFISPLAHTLLSMASHQENQSVLVRNGCVALTLQAMSVSAISSELRLSFARTFTALSELPVAKEFFDQEDHVSPLFKFMFAHQSDSNLLLLSLRSFSSIVERSPCSRLHILGHPPALSFLLECLTDATSGQVGSKVFFAINVLKCLSMEEEIASRFASLEGLPLVPKLLLLPTDKMSRQTQYFATEMIGHMTFFGHVDELQLSEIIVARILSFASFETDELVATSSTIRALWAIAELARSSLSVQVCKWIVNDPVRLDILIKCGLLPPKHLGIPSIVIGYVLSILIRIVDVEEVASALVSKRICTALSVLLEAVEQDLRLSALKILSLLLPRYAKVGLDSPSAVGPKNEDWSMILRYLVEWMEVYARDPSYCVIASLMDAYLSLSFVSSLPVLAADFQSGIVRTGLAEIVANTMLHFDPKVADAEEHVLRDKLLLQVLKVCLNLMGYSTAYSDKIVELNVPLVLENVLQLDSDELQLETLKSMNHLASLSDDKNLLFSSYACVTRLKQLATSANLAILAMITPLLVLMTSKLSTLPGLCCLDGINIVSGLILVNWTRARSAFHHRIADDCCSMLLSMFAADENVFALYDQTQVIPKLFGIVEAYGAPELPLQVLVKISEYTPSHGRFMALLPALCQLLLGGAEQLGTKSHNLILVILFNIFCCGADVESLSQTLSTGEYAVLPQILPLSRWVNVTNPGSVQVVLKLLYAYMSTPTYRTLLNDGLNIPALLELVGAASPEVAIAAAQLLLAASDEREVQISITVEDGIGLLVRTLHRTTEWELECLILTILRNMSPDSEIQVLILNEDGVPRLIQFVNEREAELFASDKRLTLSCDILRQISHTPNAATEIVLIQGHRSIMELNRAQFTIAGMDAHCATTLEILSNLAKAPSVVHSLLDAKLHDLFLSYIMSSNSSITESSIHSESSLPLAKKLVLAGLRSLCQENKAIRNILGSKQELIPFFEDALSSTFGMEVKVECLGLLCYLSKTPEGRKSIFIKSSSSFIQRVCGLICAALSASEKTIKPSMGGSSSQNHMPSTSTITRMAIVGVKLIAHLLTDLTQERVQVGWQLDDLVSLSQLLEKLLSDHQQPRLQLIALNLLSGSFLGSSFYFQLSTQMLGDLLNILLISPSKDHYTQAENVVVSAFKDPDKIRASIRGNQILEQLLIVLTQKSDPTARQALCPALTQVLYVSMSRNFIVNQRFLSKLLSLLVISTPANNLVSDELHSTDEKSTNALVQALCVYLSFVFWSCSHTAALQSNIREVLRSEVNATAFEAIVMQIHGLHAQVCRTTSATNSPEVSALSSENLLIWNLLAECISPPMQHIQKIVSRTALSRWLCLVEDLFTALQGWDNRPQRVISFRESGHQSEADLDAEENVSGETERSLATSNTISHDIATLQTLKIASVLSRLKDHLVTEEDDSAAERMAQSKVNICTFCLQTLWTESGNIDQRHALVQAALSGLIDARDGWGENCLIAACKSYDRMDLLLAKLLQIFHVSYHALNQSRHLLLQLLLTLVSTGSYIDELKGMDIQSAIENNELIEAADKSLPITILSLLGYNADLNSEFSLALQRFEKAENTVSRKENLAYLVNFLQLYAFTDESLQQKAISVFMAELVANAMVFDPDDATNTITHDCVTGLIKLAGVRKFVQLYLQDWNLNALLNVTFARQKGDQANDFVERPGLSLREIGQLLEIASRVCRCLGVAEADPAGAVQERTLFNGLTLVQELSRQDLPLLGQLLALINWLTDNADNFQCLCLHLPMLNAFLPFLPHFTDNAGLLLEVMEKCIYNSPRVEYLTAMLWTTLEFTYNNVAALSKLMSVRGKLLLYILLIMKRMGEDGFARSDVYELSIQLILSNVRAPSQLKAQVSWDLLGMLTEFDPAITTIFNFDGIQMLLRELCPESEILGADGTSSHPSTPRGSKVSPRAYYSEMEALKCLSKSARTHDEVLFKIGEITGIGITLFKVLVKVDSDTLMQVKEVSELPPGVNIAESQEHAAHLIARISSQECLRASILSQEHVSVLIESLESVHLKVVLYSLETLYNLCEFTICLDALVCHATVPVLGQILFSPLAAGETQSKTEDFVLGILGNMCSKSKLICRRVVSSNLVPKLNDFLSSPRKSIHHNAAWVINCLSKDAELVPKLRENGVPETLCDQLLQYDPSTTQCKALGALANLLALSRISPIARAIIRQTVESININIPNPQAQHAIARGFGVFETIAAQSLEAKQILFEENAIQITLVMLGATDQQVRLKALEVIAKWLLENPKTDQIHELFVDSTLLAVVRVISEEPSEILLVALTLLNLLLSDEFLKEKLASMTYEVLLRLVATHCSHNLTALQGKILSESLRSLVTMTKMGKVSVSTSSAIVNSIEPLITLLRAATSDSIRMSALYLLVNFASVIELRASMLHNGALQALNSILRVVDPARDEKVIQLCLLGLALLTAVDFSDHVEELSSSTVEALIGFLSSKNPSVQANAVWVLSNISSEGQSVVSVLYPFAVP
uniref:Vacuolar protein 8 n=1 Tax=Globisporangium ultimum (strain ATCC 200006 / CBS 805.95 / DAOM BR144) TaxID=431595 RepID=K3X6I8_GLOUD